MHIISPKSTQVMPEAVPLSLAGFEHLEIEEVPVLGASKHYSISNGARLHNNENCATLLHASHQVAEALSDQLYKDPEHWVLTLSGSANTSVRDAAPKVHLYLFENRIEKITFFSDSLGRIAEQSDMFVLEEVLRAKYQQSALVGATIARANQFLPISLGDDKNRLLLTTHFRSHPSHYVVIKDSTVDHSEFDYRDLNFWKSAMNAANYLSLINFKFSEFYFLSFNGRQVRAMPEIPHFHVEVFENYYDRRCQHAHSLGVFKAE